MILFDFTPGITADYDSISAFFNAHDSSTGVQDVDGLLTVLGQEKQNITASGSYDNVFTSSN